MDKVIRAINSLPAFLSEFFTEHPILAVIGLLIFLSALIVQGRIGALIRKIVVLANILWAMAGGFMGSRQNGHEIICLSAIALIVMFIVRRVIRIIGAIQYHKQEARIRKRAHVLAAKRRHSFRRKESHRENPRESSPDESEPSKTMTN